MFLRIEHKWKTISSIIVFSPVSIFDLEMPKIYCFAKPEFCFDRDESFPLDDGLIAGNYSIFFKEFLRIKVGLFYILLAST